VSYSGSEVLHVDQQDLRSIGVSDRAGLLAVGVLGFLDAQELVHLAQQRHERRLLQPLELLTAEPDPDTRVIAAFQNHPNAHDEALCPAGPAAE
jgi:hypothetical protein